MSTRNQVLKLYKSLIRESQKFASYNFRVINTGCSAAECKVMVGSYAVRRVRDAFKENRGITDTEILNNQLAEAHKNLEVVRRQALISQMYKADKLVIENMQKK